MKYFDFRGEKISRLGFGLMRFPLLEDKSIDKAQVAEMFKAAIDGGVNYFDTAWPYHDGQSESIVKELLVANYPRESFYLADKFPGHQFFETIRPEKVEEIFETQLAKCGVDYFDFYLLHNVCEISIDNYESPVSRIIEYFEKQRELGRIKHLGFSSHALPDLLDKFLSDHEGAFEFCQLQFNYLDWTLQDADKKLEILTRHGVPMWVMEPLRGGKLAEDRELAFRFIDSKDNVGVILSGMSSLEQMKQNIETFSGDAAFSAEDEKYLLDKAETMKDAIPCTACGYCKAGCPMELDIPKLIAAYNDSKYAISFAPSMFIEALPDDKKPGACLGCGACAQICPQKIDIPEVMKKFSEMNLISWKALCEEREKARK